MFFEYKPGQRVKVKASDNISESKGTIIEYKNAGGEHCYVVQLDNNTRDLVHINLLSTLREPNPVFLEQLPQSKPIEIPDALPVAAPDWLEEVYTHVENGNNARGNFILYSHINELLIANKFAWCDALLSFIDVERLNTFLLVTLLAALKNITPEKLKNRAALVERAKIRLQLLAPERHQKLTENLI